MKVYFLSIVLFFSVTEGYSQFLQKRGLSPDGHVFDMELKDNILYVGGSFKRVGYLSGGTAKLNGNDLLPDLDFPYIDGEVYSIIPDGSGGWFVGGDFDRAGSLNRSNLVHILSTMEVDPDFQPVVNNMVTCLALSGNTLYFGGRFTMVGSEQRSYLAAWDVSANTLTSFNPSPSSWVYDIEVHNNELILAGRFTSVGDSTFRGLANINLTNGQVQSFPALPSGEANDLFTDGNMLYVAGTFPGGAMSVDLQTKTKTGWNPNITGSFFGVNVNAILKVGSTIYFGGSFSQINGESRKNLGALEENGAVSDFAPEPDAEVFTLFYQDNYIYTGGDFKTFGGHDLPHIARFNLNGEVDESWRINPSWAVRSFSASANYLLAGGEFDMLSAQQRNSVFAMDVNTGQLLDWNPQGNFLTINDLKVDELRDVVYLCGWDSQTSQHFKAFNGTTGEPLEGWEWVFDGAVYAIDQNNETGDIYIGGAFSKVNGENRNRMAAIDQDASLLPFSVSPNHEVRKIVVSEEHDLVYFAGNFDQVNNTERLKTAAVDFSGQLSAWNPELSRLALSAIYLSEILPMTDKVFLSGNFESIRGEVRERIGAVDPLTGDVLDWNANAFPVSPLQGSIDHIKPFNNALLVKGTRIPEIGGQAFTSLAVLGTQSAQVLDMIPYFGIGDGQPVHAMEILDSAIFLGGSFELLEERYHPFFAAYIFSSDNQPVAGGKIDKYSPKEGGNTGDVTIEIFGSGLKEGSEILLRKDGMQDIAAAPNSTFNYNEVRLSATFNLLGAETGFRDIVLNIPNDTVIVLTNAFEIKVGMGPNPWAELVTPYFVTAGAEEFFYLSYGNSGDTDAHGIPLWVSFSPNIEVLDTGFDIIRTMEPSSLHYDSIPQFVLIDSLLGQPYEAKIYSYIIPKIPAGSSFMVAFKIKGTEEGDFYSRAWVDRPMFGSPLKYYAGECFDAIFLNVIGFVPFGSCVAGVLDAVISPFTDYAWDPEFGSASWTVSYLEVLVSAALSCGGDVVTGGVAGIIKHALEALLNAHAIYEMIQVCTKPEDKADNRGEFVASCDPNDKSGPVGQGAEGWLNTNKTFPYMIRFENKPEATAPAKQVTIKDTLDLMVFDLSTLQLKGFTIADSIYNIQSASANYNTIADLRPRLPYLVELNVSADSVSGQLTWEFVTLNPENMQPVTGAMEGFLPPDTDSISGRGSVFYDIEVFQNLEPGTEIRNQAAIYFDFNEPIITNEWLLKADNDLPVSQVNQLADTVFTSEFMVHWSGSDATSGIKHYDVVYRENGGNWYFAGTQVKDTFLLFQGNYGSYYEFYTIAYDNALNEEFAPVDPDAHTFVKQINTGVSDHSALNDLAVRVRPNPVEHFLHIDVSGNLASLSVWLTDMTGIPVLRQNFRNVSAQTITLDLHSLPSGVYILNYSAEGKTGNRKIVKF